VRAHGYEVVRGSPAERNDLTGSGAFGYDERKLFNSVELQFRNFAFEVTLRLLL
jgi:hypothetical protein